MILSLKVWEDSPYDGCMEKAESISAFGEFLSAARDVFFPSFCVNCRTRIILHPNPYFCQTCWDTYTPVDRPVCEHCGKPMGIRVGFDAPVELLCPICRQQTEPGYDRALAVGTYEGILKEAVLLLKFHAKTLLAEFLGARLADFSESDLDLQNYNALCPVPLHRVRQRERGFNQSQLLADALAHSIGYPPVKHLLFRNRPTLPQTHMTLKQRRNNVKGAFTIVDAEKVAGGSFLLIDDVMTTGSTLAECARTLKKHEAERVDALVLCTTRLDKLFSP